MNFTVRSLTAAALAALILSGCSSVDMGPATVIDRSSYQPDTSAQVVTPNISGITDSGRQHVVAAGDTIYNISKRYGLDARQLQTLNGVTDPTQLRLGQTLRLPVSVKDAQTYVVNPLIRVNQVSADQVLETPSSVREAQAAAKDAANAAARKTEETATNVKTQVASAKTQATQQLNAVTPGQRMIWPVYGKVTSSYADNKKGLDIAGTAGDPVVAAMQGVVLFSDIMEGYGRLVIMRHQLPNRMLVTAYGHLDNVVAKAGDEVKAGQKIAELAKQEGGATLRFEVREKGKSINPENFLPKRP